METEITKKIRTAIENKLIEYDAFVDKELPEYIMVMVANKKTKQQMDEDLSLFLGKKVGKFTTWLLKMLHVEKQSDSKSSVISHHPSDEDDVLALDAQEQETDEFLKKELGEESVHNKSEIPEAPRQEPVIDMEVDPVQTSDNDTGRVTAKEVFQKQSESLVKSPTVTKQAQSKSARIKIPSVEEVEEAEYDPLNPSINIKSVANKILIPEKKYSISSSSKANKLMLLKAVDEANKSILSEKKLEEVYNPTPIKVLVSHANRNQSKSFSREYKPSPLVKTVHRYEEEEEDEDIEKVEYVPKPYASWHYMKDSHPSPLNAYRELICDNLFSGTVNRKVICNTDDTSEDFFNADRVSSNGTTRIKSHARPVSPHFVVTLDGYEAKSRKRSLSSLSQNEESDKEDIENMDIPLIPELLDEPSAKKSKTLERCHFWPACKNGDSCEFHHPSSPCKTFPNCKFGDKCFYIHPKCKFDVLCTRKDCPFSHTCKRDRKDFPISKGPPIAIRNPYPSKFVSVPQAYNSSSPQCKFYPNCTAYKCPYFHPKPCRYGTDCQSSTCTFTHPMFPSPNQLKWKAGSI